MRLFLAKWNKIWTWLNEHNLTLCSVCVGYEPRFNIIIEFILRSASISHEGLKWFNAADERQGRGLRSGLSASLVSLFYVSISIEYPTTTTTSSSIWRFCEAGCLFVFLVYLFIFLFDCRHLYKSHSINIEIKTEKSFSNEYINKNNNGLCLFASSVANSCDIRRYFHWPVGLKWKSHQNGIGESLVHWRFYAVFWWQLYRNVSQRLSYIHLNKKKNVWNNFPSNLFTVCYSPYRENQEYCKRYIAVIDTVEHLQSLHG